MTSETLFEPDFYTIGYEDFSVFELIEVLKGYKIKTLIDIRSVPYSQYNAQFSKKNLEQVLWRDHIAYVHMKELGNPKKFWGKPNWKTLYRNLILPQLPGLLDRMKRMDGPICLMCREKHYEHCHRSIVAHELSFSGFMGKNLRKIY